VAQPANRVATLAGVQMPQGVAQQHGHQRPQGGSGQQHRQQRPQGGRW
jgi:hypothetical protein